MCKRTDSSGPEHIRQAHIYLVWVPQPRPLWGWRRSSCPAFRASYRNQELSIWHPTATFVSRRKSVEFGQVWPPRWPNRAGACSPGIVWAQASNTFPGPSPGRFQVGMWKTNHFPRMCMVPRLVAPEKCQHHLYWESQGPGSLLKPCRDM